MADVRLMDSGDPSRMPELNEEVTELHCHSCGGYIRFSLDRSLNGNHVLNCPKCGHEHCRVVKDGKVTDERFDQRNGSQGTGGTGYYRYTLTMANYSSTAYQSVPSGSTSTDSFLMDSWLNTTSTTGNYATSPTYVVV